ncbi:pilus assembly protein [Pseudovibrio exalbescens]|uniref:TadE/TadG family type IV pilus assembly protein n=1 Tax=Pseudovibrio exalbescens TaxID=197461 RepID=UPI002364FF63|nr:TadE/TadG family type IV pilus assembly protein [Pseudovibrio exalbescens]MDD7910101.1 pilus assembly protein [Pseudovibrio exalbescens]
MFKSLTHLPAMFARFLRDRSAVAALEFAIVFPFLLFLFVAMTEMTTSLNYDRKVDQVSITLADLIARESTLTAKQLEDLFSAAEQLMKPFDGNGMRIEVGVVKFVGTNLDPAVVWSVGKTLGEDTNLDQQPWPVGQAPSGIDIPDELASSSSNLIVTKTKFDYRFLTGTLLHRLSSGDSFSAGKMELGGLYFTRSRQSNTVDFER